MRDWSNCLHPCIGLESTWEAWCRRLWWILDWMGSSTRHTCRDFFINYNANTVNIVAATCPCMGQTACLVQYTDGTDWGCIKNGRILSILISLFLFLFGGGFVFDIRIHNLNLGVKIIDVELRNMSLTKLSQHSWWNRHMYESSMPASTGCYNRHCWLK